MNIDTRTLVDDIRRTITSTVVTFKVGDPTDFSYVLFDPATYNSTYSGIEIFYWSTGTPSRYYWEGTPNALIIGAPLRMGSGLTDSFIDVEKRAQVAIIPNNASTPTGRIIAEVGAFINDNRIHTIFLSMHKTS
jgi:hypothetical protein